MKLHFRSTNSDPPNIVFLHYKDIECIPCKGNQIQNLHPNYMKIELCKVCPLFSDDFLSVKISLVLGGKAIERGRILSIFARELQPPEAKNSNMQQTADINIEKMLIGYTCTLFTKFKHV